MSSPAQPPDTAALGRFFVPVRGQRVMPEDIRGRSSCVASSGNPDTKEPTRVPASAAGLAAQLDDLPGLMAPASGAPPAAPRREMGFPTSNPGRASATKARPHINVSP